MKFQGLLLAAIILVSVFFTSSYVRLLIQERGNNPQFLVETAKSQETQAVNSSSAAAVLKTTSAGDNVTTTQNLQPKIYAQVFLKRLLNTGVDLAEQKTENRWPIASLTKLMTALIVTEKIDLNTEIKLSEHAIEAEGVSGDFRVGDTYKASNLLKAMLTLSSNDAAEALAETYGEQDFITAMNQKAVELKMTETKFVDPTGISFLNQSTANDLAKLVNYIYLNNPEIFKITTQKIISITETQSEKSRILNSINEFAGQANFLGGKTGFIDESKGNLISLFQDSNGRGPILIIVLGSEDRFGDTRLLLNN
ncbi:MAG: serine hydrolase [Candidatus Paceibacterota bacterium]|jgi:D-alanyl-D-alanine carboxypeptidase